MSGHSKWHSIKHQKMATDQKRGKIFTKHAKAIAVAAQKGGDPVMNPALRIAIEAAKAENVPNGNIERAIKKGTGELKDGTVISEVIYEGYGPGGIALYIRAITDNKNRSVASVRNIFEKYNGKLGNTGSVAWMFEQKGVLRIAADPQRTETFELAAIDAGALDITHTAQEMEIITTPETLSAVRGALTKISAQILSAEITLIPKNTVSITDKKTAQQILKLMDALEEDEDVDSVASNFDIDDALLR